MRRAILLDISGVLHEDSQPLDGALEAVERLQKAGLVLRFVTNTSRRTGDAVHDSLVRMGFSLSRGQVFTAPGAIRDYLIREGRRPFLLIHRDLEPEFADLDTHDPDAVVLGDAEERLDYRHLDAAFQLLQQGAPLLAVGTNRYFRQQGSLHLDVGPFVRALEYAADLEATVFGKPSSAFFQAVLDDAGVAPEEALMVGDDVECDVIAALDAGLDACLVRSGKYRPGDEDKARGARVEPDLATLVDHLVSHR